MGEEAEGARRRRSRPRYACEGVGDRLPSSRELLRSEAQRELQAMRVARNVECATQQQHRLHALMRRTGLGNRVRQRRPLGAGGESEAIARPAQRQRDATARGLRHRIYRKVVALRPQLAQRAEISLHESRTLVRKRDDVANAGNALQQLSSLAIGCGDVDDRARQQLVNFQQQGCQEQSVADTSVDAANEHAGDLIRPQGLERRCPRPHETGEQAT